mgnify:CR=1 FL=1
MDAPYYMHRSSFRLKSWKLIEGSRFIGWFLDTHFSLHDIGLHGVGDQIYIMHDFNFLPKVLDITYYHGQVLFDHFLLVLIFLNSLWLNFLMFYENPLWDLSSNSSLILDHTWDNCWLNLWNMFPSWRMCNWMIYCVCQHKCMTLSARHHGLKHTSTIDRYQLPL